MALVYVGLGSNIDPEKNLRLGVDELRRRYGDVVVSRVYRNAAVGFEGADFLNLVAGFRSNEEPGEINRQIEQIHDLVGRERGDERFAARALDIDLLLYDDLVSNDPPLPRADVLEYSFVLRPLAEIAPDLVHPVTGRRMADHWQECDPDRHPLTLVDVIL
ncbi:MAG: 2-amino-4-hydroxy-6-hydroxymethyldihydropteridine diphosphokinase [Woeseiaceae bacterium]|nr:2-amino-4-hydroxy-6-hydroxymethyldihydropteridine diphosphokinase [Woeseiaceae bacterium]